MLPEIYSAPTTWRHVKAGTGPYVNADVVRCESCAYCIGDEYPSMASRCFYFNANWQEFRIGNRGGCSWGKPRE